MLTPVAGEHLSMYPLLAIRMSSLEKCSSPLLLLKKILDFNFYLMCVSVCVSHTGTRRGQRRVPDPLELVTGDGEPPIVGAGN